MLKSLENHSILWLSQFLLPNLGPVDIIVDTNIDNCGIFSFEITYFILNIKFSPCLYLGVVELFVYIVGGAYPVTFYDLQSLHLLP